LIIDEKGYLQHYGIIRRSGRYPWGSGGEEGGSERHPDFLGTVAQLRKDGLSEPEIAAAMGMTTTELRAQNSIERNKRKQAQIAEAERLKSEGWSNVAIGERMGIPESSVRALLAPGQKDKADVLTATVNSLKTAVDRKPYLDVGAGVEYHVGVSQTKFKTALAQLKSEGYKIHYVKVQQLGTGKFTTVKVLTKPGVPYSDVFKNREKIQQYTDYSEDGGHTYRRIEPPVSISAKRVAVRYADQGGAAADGVIYVRRGKADTSLGASNYAQVRIAVDGSHYLKGMAMYADDKDFPPGVDLIFNTNKTSTGNKLDAMKKLNIDRTTGEIDKDSPFGATITRQNGVMNIVNEEGSWSAWSRSLSSQMLSKQSPALAKSQLDMTYERKKNKLDEIMALTNPVVRKKMLDEFAESADASAVHLKAAALPNQGSHVILPINSMRETEIYAPNYKNGEQVVLIRYPHGGVFEIPSLTVNNRHPEAKKVLGNAKDAVGINSKVAERLSGADFDGDTVLVIPNNHGKIKTAPALEGLKGFDPQKAYPGYEGMTRMTPKVKAFEMGDISNLITDMTIHRATSAELARAVRHSMVVIDAEKHGLNWKQSAVDNGIAQLKIKYQGKKNAGAATLISRATSRTDVPERKTTFKVDPVTGEKIHLETGNSWVDKNGKVVTPTQRSTKLAETSDAHTLSSGTVIEKVYADHSNRLKKLANQARLASIGTMNRPYSPSAKAAYSAEVASLDAKLNIALRNAPLERQAQIVANAQVSRKREANPGMDEAELKKVKSQALTTARLRTGAQKKRIEITDAEWAAIQAGAISNDKLSKILNNADMDRVAELATPKTRTTMSAAQASRARQMLAQGYTQAEVAEHLGVSVNMVKDSVKDG
jgi:hypothetical protein